jgi:large conductance mechanosensitive channel
VGRIGKRSGRLRQSRLRQSKPLKLVMEFREFVNRGNVIDLAVAVIMGAAFTAIVNSVVNDLATPLISLISGGFDFTRLALVFGEGEGAAVFRYGMLIQSVLNFLVISLIVFFIIKAVNKVARRKPDAQPAQKPCPYCGSDIPLSALRCPHCTTILDEERFRSAGAAPRGTD